MFWRREEESVNILPVIVVAFHQAIQPERLAEQRRTTYQEHSQSELYELPRP